MKPILSLLFVMAFCGYTKAQAVSSKKNAETVESVNHDSKSAEKGNATTATNVSSQKNAVIKEEPATHTNGQTETPPAQNKPASGARKP